MTALALAVSLACALHDRGSGIPQEPDPRLDRALVLHLERTADDAFVPVVFHAGQASVLQPAERWAVLAGAEGASPRERRLDGRRRLVSALQARAATAHAELLAKLHEGSEGGRVRGLRELWLINAVACEIQSEFLQEVLASLSPVPFRIRLDLPRGVGGSVQSTGWGIDKIEAETLASTDSVDGSGVVVAVIDIGFQKDHGDVEGRVHADSWDFVDDDDDVDDTNIHGAYVSGVVGGDGTGGTRTGVAAGVSLMLLRVGASSNAVTEGHVWEAMGHALAKDADVVNLSMQWPADCEPDFASWRTAVDVLTEAGVLFVTICGNDANLRYTPQGVLGPPDSVTTPGRVPSALTVGATNSSDVLWYDSSSPPAGSNTGPVTWQDVAAFGDYPYPPGLTKPDVVAPGVVIPTTGLAPDAYLTRTGTSLAAPHVSGSVALLLQKDANLGPYELRYLIEESAVDLGEPGPDVVHGWGRLDAVRAAALLPIDADATDLAITATDIWIDNDGDGAEDEPLPGEKNDLYARVRNLGGSVVGDVKLAFYCADLSTGSVQLDPDADGDLADGDFELIGTYAVPVVGPASSAHGAATGVVRWDMPIGEQRVAVVVRCHAPNPAEIEVANNAAFRDFAEPLESGETVDLRIEPPRESSDPFALEVIARGFPVGTKVYLGVAGGALPVFLDTTGVRPWIGGEGASRYALYELTDEVSRFEKLISPSGVGLPFTLSVHLPVGRAPSPGASVVLRTFDADGRKVLDRVLPVSRASRRPLGGPYSPRKH